MSVANEPTGENPLVTFVLVAYNQEKFIRSAVEGAFSQTYQPLEIILSDDSSTDGTFEIMREMADSYGGPHRVRAIRNEENIGVVRHCLRVGKMASGDVVIIAAGDDISVPERTASLITAFDDTTGAAYSLLSIIDDVGNEIVPLSERQYLNFGTPTLYLRDKEKDFHAVMGCSAAYRKWAFNIPINLTLTERGEDKILALYVSLMGAEIKRIDSPLVRYRHHSGSMTNRPKSETVLAQDEELAAAALAESRVRELNDFENLAVSLGKLEVLDADRLESERQSSRELATWPTLSYRARVKGIFTTAVSGDLKRSKWMLGRLWGHDPRRYQPKMFVARVNRR
jgi:glycosyltransferase involved in cell wall biosynthesis